MPLREEYGQAPFVIRHDVDRLGTRTVRLHTTTAGGQYVLYHLKIYAIEGGGYLVLREFGYRWHAITIPDGATSVSPSVLPCGQAGELLQDWLTHFLADVA